MSIDLNFVIWCVGAFVALAVLVKLWNLRARSLEEKLHDWLKQELETIQKKKQLFETIRKKKAAMKKASEALNSDRHSSADSGDVRKAA